MPRITSEQIRQAVLTDASAWDPDLPPEKLALFNENGDHVTPVTDDQLPTGLPEGGTTSQILSKASDDDFDAEWADPPEGGDGGGSDLPVGGTTNQVLGKASDDDFDVEWVDPAEGGGGGTPLPTGGTLGQLLAKASSDDFDVEWITPIEGGGGSSEPNFGPGFPTIFSEDYFTSLDAWTTIEETGSSPTFEDGALIAPVGIHELKMRRGPMAQDAAVMAEIIWDGTDVPGTSVISLLMHVETDRRIEVMLHSGSLHIWTFLSGTPSLKVNGSVSSVPIGADFRRFWLVGTMQDDFVRAKIFRGHPFLDDPIISMDFDLKADTDFKERAGYCGFRLNGSSAAPGTLKLEGIYAGGQ